MPETSHAAYYFEDDGHIPNHPRLPLIVYRGALSDQTDEIERIFNRNNWRNSWINGVYDFHHYHSNSHEVLGIYSGIADLLIGGEKGQTFAVQAGDVILLPAGTGHKRMKASSDFKVVGAYPNGMNYNTRRGTLAERSADLIEIAKVPVPDRDPVYGTVGPLFELWSYEHR
ncbi:uncharacterized protein YjlB [Paenibacillus endophyticus]|uniref:Uncharacterized protein YjlB n=1 Tax=Paenibacillus endophyticus TaxID=1294268 RepID=A0A7W5G8U1_9BACL|nr:hypothetical protein [Paenibacillus endophyticus]MBB3151015.1 uncharacterized protein YjlB [Paenibacillus endophyticus]